MKVFDKFNCIVTHPDKSTSIKEFEYLNLWYEINHKLLSIDSDMNSYHFLDNDYTEQVSDEIIDKLNSVLKDNYFAIKASQDILVFFRGKYSNYNLQKLNNECDNVLWFYSTNHKTYL